MRLDAAAERRLEAAARLTRQSRSAFLGSAVDERARRILLDWALERHRAGEASFSELAAETGLAVEEIMMTAGDGETEAALEAFLAGCRTIAEAQHNPEFLAAGEKAVELAARTLHSQ